MPEWTKESEQDRRRALENVYMLAKRKRVAVHRYDAEGNVIGTIGPKSADADWDHIIRFCEEAGLKPSILREAARTPKPSSAQTSAKGERGNGE